MRYIHEVSLIVIGSQPFCIINQTGEDDHAQTQKHSQDEQLLHAGMQSVPQDLEAGRMAGQFEHAEHPEHSDHSENASRLTLTALGRKIYRQKNTTQF